MLYYSKGTDDGYKDAFKWYRKAAEQNDADAQFFLGRMYFEGKGIESNTQEAITWMKVSADNGNEYAKEIVSKAEKKCQ
jgi:hypothetical protein